MKKLRIREQRKRECIFTVWTLLGAVGLVWLLSLPFSFLGRLLDEKEGEKAVEEMAGYIENERADPTDNRVSDAAGNDNIDTSCSEEGDMRSGLTEVVWGMSEESQQNDCIVRICRELYEEYKELLVLINREHELEEGAYEDTLRSICNGRLQASDYLYDDLVDMLAAAKDAGYQYWIASAYRSRDRQQALVNEDVERYMAQGMRYAEALEKTYKQTMPAGKSEHETGLALDLLCSENVNMDISQADEPGNQWLAEHAHEYGFILRYPKDKEEITGIFYEPWHFRYVGKEAAVFLHEQGWTLEEFHGRL